MLIKKGILKTDEQNTNVIFWLISEALTKVERKGTKGKLQHTNINRVI